MPNQPSWLLRWIGVMIGFEALGFAVAFATGNLVYALALADAPEGTELALPGTIALACLVGAIEGTMLATGQWLMLRRKLPALRWTAWAGSTAIGGALAWAIGMGLGTSLGDGVTETPPAWLLGLVFVGSGLAFGGLLGTCQWLVLRLHLARATTWIGANAFGWMVGLAAAYTATNWIDETTPLGLMIVIGVLAGAAMAVTPALTTGFMLLRRQPIA
jgi:hypothetical protein